MVLYFITSLKSKCTKIVKGKMKTADTLYNKIQLVLNIPLAMDKPSR